MPKETKPNVKDVNVATPYHSWLLRIWQEHADAPWRFQLKSVSSGTQLLFEDLPALFDFLAEEMDPKSPVK